jgi:hypothetical protein
VGRYSRDTDADKEIESEKAGSLPAFFAVGRSAKNIFGPRAKLVTQIGYYCLPGCGK